jgi:hypothetical protein
VTNCGLTGPLFEIEMVAPLTPVPLGVNVTDMVQLVPAERLVPQLFVCAKSLPLAPVSEIELSNKAAVPVFETVNA